MIVAVWPSVPGVELPDPLGPEPVDPRLLQPRRARLGQVPHEPERRQVVALPHLDREAPDALHHRGHQVHDVDRVLLDRGERCLGVEARQHHEVRAGEQRDARPDHRTVVVQRPGHQQAAVGIHPQGRAGLGVLVAGSPATISFGRPVEPPEVGAFHDGEVTSGRGASSSEGAARSPAGRQARPGSRSGFDADHDLRVGELDDGLQLGVGQPVRHGLRDGADLPRRGGRHEPLDRVRQRDRHHVAEPDATLLQVAGQPVGRRLEPGPRDRVVAAGDQHPVGIRRGQIGEPPRVRDHLSHAAGP